MFDNTLKPIAKFNVFSTAQIVLITLGMALALTLILGTILVFPPAVVLPILGVSMVVDGCKLGLTGMQLLRQPKLSDLADGSTLGIGLILLILSLALPPFTATAGLILGVVLIAKETIEIGTIVKELIDLKKNINRLSQADNAIQQELQQHHHAYLKLAESLVKIVVSSVVIASIVAILVVFPPALPIVGIAGAAFYLSFKAYERWGRDKLLQWLNQKSETVVTRQSQDFEDTTLRIFKEEIAHDGKFNRQSAAQSASEALIEKPKPVESSLSQKKEENDDSEGEGEGSNELPHLSR